MASARAPSRTLIAVTAVVVGAPVAQQVALYGVYALRRGLTTADQLVVAGVVGVASCAIISFLLARTPAQAPGWLVLSAITWCASAALGARISHDSMFTGNYWLPVWWTGETSGYVIKATDAVLGGASALGSTAMILAHGNVTVARRFGLWISWALVGATVELVANSGVWMV